MFPVGVGVLGGVAAAAVPFPAAEQWVPLARNQLPFEDAAGDQLVPPADPGLDLVGDATSPVVWWYADADTFFLRASVAAEPTSNGLWAFPLSTDGNNDNWEALLTIEGPGNVLLAWTNPPGAFGLQPPRTIVSPTGYGRRATGEVRFVTEGGLPWVDLQFPRAVLHDELGVYTSGAFRIAAFTGTSWAEPPVDLTACDGLTSTCTALSPALADAIRIDFDNDGLTYPQELELGTGVNDGDSDDDGVPDGDEAFDLDGDGTLDALECDTDEDGLPDGLERGYTTPLPTTNLNARCFLPDTDPSTRTDPTNADTDGGGWTDAEEDVDADGMVDLWETDPRDPSDDVDSDGDGIADVLDDRLGRGPDEDSDGDGIGDAAEGAVDTDGDGLADFVDPDSDGDGYPDVEEGEVDSDVDGIGDWKDEDSDGDGLPDVLESDGDSDGDGVDDRLDRDSDDDGLRDGAEGEGDFDGDGVPDLYDTDSDGDGIPDGVEGEGDTDGDGVPDVHDDDSDGDGWSDAIEFDSDGDGEADDTDRDGKPDFQDTNSDGDGVADADEPDGDVDCDGLPDRLDRDREDSFCDEVDDPAIEDGGPPPPPDRGEADPLASPGTFGGGTCDVASGASAGWGALAVALAVLRRRRRVVVGALLPGAAMAQDVDADRFGPSVDGGELVVVESVGERDRAGASAWLDHADDPLVYHADDGEDVPLLHAVSTLRLQGFGRLGSLRVGAELPVHASIGGELAERPTSLGDVRLSSELCALRAGSVAAGLLADLSLPTGDPALALGAGRAGTAVAAVTTLDLEGVLLSGEVGFRSGTGRSLGSLAITPAVTAGIGAVARVTDGFGLGLEVVGEQWTADPGEPGATPVQALVSARREIGDGALRLAAGTGLGAGVGAPDLRLALGLSWRLGT